MRRYFVTMGEDPPPPKGMTKYFSILKREVAADAKDAALDSKGADLDLETKLTLSMLALERRLMRYIFAAMAGGAAGGTGITKLLE